MISSAESSIDRPTTSDSPVIIYDGECIFCRNYVRLIRLRETIGRIRLVDARSPEPIVAEYQGRGYDLNEGMLFVFRGQVYHGSAAIHVLSTLSTPVSFFNKVNKYIFSNHTASCVFYPLLKVGRRVTLFLRGKTLISNSSSGRDPIQRASGRIVR